MYVILLLIISIISMYVYILYIFIIICSVINSMPQWPPPTNAQASGIQNISVKKIMIEKHSGNQSTKTL